MLILLLKRLIMKDNIEQLKELADTLLAAYKNPMIVEATSDEFETSLYVMFKRIQRRVDEYNQTLESDQT